MCISFLQAEDGIRYGHVTGVQTCALPILSMVALLPPELDNAWVKLFGGLLDHKPTHIPLTHHLHAVLLGQHLTLFASKIGRASCRERELIMVSEVVLSSISNKTLI